MADGGGNTDPRPSKLDMWRTYRLAELAARVPGAIKKKKRTQIHWTVDDRVLLRAFLARHAHSPDSVSAADRGSCGGCTDAALRKMAADIGLDTDRISDLEWLGIKDRMLMHFSGEMARWVDEGKVRREYNRETLCDTFVWDEATRSSWEKAGAALRPAPATDSASPRTGSGSEAGEDQRDPVCQMTPVTRDNPTIPLPQRHDAQMSPDGENPFPVRSNIQQIPSYFHAHPQDQQGVVMGGGEEEEESSIVENHAPGDGGGNSIIRERGTGADADTVAASPTQIIIAHRIRLIDSMAEARSLRYAARAAAQPQPQRVRQRNQQQQVLALARAVQECSLVWGQLGTAVAVCGVRAWAMAMRVLGMLLDRHG
ncbi:hypothetical protein EsH8_XIII_000036 [Colletotrichum jinshuiense]